jgi:hypothetical protein
MAATGMTKEIELLVSWGVEAMLLKNYPRAEKDGFGFQSGVTYSPVAVDLESQTAKITLKLPGEFTDLNDSVAITISLDECSHHIHLLAAATQQLGVEEANRFFSRG